MHSASSTTSCVVVVSATYIYYCPGELFYHLQKEKKFSEDRVRFYAAEIVLGLAYLHKQGVIYRYVELEHTGERRLVYASPSLRQRPQARKPAAYWRRAHLYDRLWHLKGRPCLQGLKDCHFLRDSRVPRYSSQNQRGMRRCGLLTSWLQRLRY